MKREITKATMAVAMLPAAVACGACGTEAEEPVNILWLFGEDISPWMSLYGDSTVETPNIDFLAQNGVTFTNCYSTCSVSSPTRSAIITGAMQTTIGMHNHRTGRSDKLIYELPEHVQILPQILREHGYFTYNAGKDDYNWQYKWEDYWSGAHERVSFYGLEGDDLEGKGQGHWDQREEGAPFFGSIELKGGKNHNKPANPVDINKVKIPPYYPETQICREYLSNHYNQIIQTDIEIGNVIERMKKEGVYENTIIIFLSDNGYESMRDKQFLYDGGIHMPFIVAAPGNHKLLERLGVKIGSVREDMISLLDVTATTLSLANIPIPEYMESLDIFAKDYHRDFIVAARDRCDFTVDRIRAIRDREFKYIRNFMTDRPLMQPQYRDGRFYYNDILEAYKSGTPKFADEWLSDERPAEELYDIVNDPHEIHNLAADPRYKEELLKMRDRLDTWIEETNDQGQYPEPVEEFEILLERWGDKCVNPEYDEAKRRMGIK